MAKKLSPAVVNSCTAFNTVYSDFLRDLCSTYTSTEPLEIALERFNSLVAVDVCNPVNRFYETAIPHARMFAARNTDALLTCYKTLDVFEGIQLPKLWKKSSETTRDAIWDYMCVLWSGAVAFKCLPTDWLDRFGSVARMTTSKDAKTALQGMGLNKEYHDAIEMAGATIGDLDSDVMQGMTERVKGAKDPRAMMTTLMDDPGFNKLLDSVAGPMLQQMQQLNK
jgi:hypothetical protein